MDGKTLKEIRLFYEITQQQLADKLGVTRGYLSQIERGLKPVSPQLQMKIAKLTTPTRDLIDTLDQLKFLSNRDKRT